MEQWAEVSWYIYLLYDAAGLGMALLLSDLFYRCLWPALFSAAGVRLYHRMVQRLWRERKQRQFRLEFRDALQQLQGYLQAGRSLENAMYETGIYLERYQSRGLLYPQWKRMTSRLRRNGTAEQVWTEFARRNPVEEAKQFAGILSAAKRSGGSMGEIIQNAVGKISLLIQTEEEIEGIIAASRLQMYVLEIVPVALLGYMNFAAPELTEPMYGSVTGTFVMTVCLGIYLCAAWLGSHITDIRV